MTYLTAKELREQLATIPDDTKIVIKARTNDGDSLYFDLNYDTVKDNFMGGILFLNSKGLDLVIEAEKEEIRGELLW